jgi:hypothetical protein
VSRDVAALYAQPGRIEHVVRLNGADSDIDMYTLECIDADARAKEMPDKWPPALTPENIRRYTRALIASVLERAVKEGRPLSSYAATFDWDKQVGSAWRSSELRELFVEAADCPILVEELDASGDDTLLLFLFANDRYDRTVKITSRGFLVGSAGRS